MTSLQYDQLLREAADNVSNSTALIRFHLVKEKERLRKLFAFVQKISGRRTETEILKLLNASKKTMLSVNMQSSLNWNILTSAQTFTRIHFVFRVRS